MVERREIAGLERDMLGFDTLTRAPLDLALIEPKLLDRDEIAWLNAYHARVRREISPLVEPKGAPLAPLRDETDRRSALEQSNLGGYIISCQPHSQSS